MNTNEIVEISTEAIKKTGEQSHFSARELQKDLESSVSKQEIEEVLQLLQETGWIEQKNMGLPIWESGPTGRAYLSGGVDDDQTFRVLPGEVPKEETTR